MSSGSRAAAAECRFSIRRDHVLGRISLPSREELAADIAQWRGRLAECAGPFDEIDFQASYVVDLDKGRRLPQLRR